LVRGRDASYLAPTGSPEAIARLRFPQSVACGFTAVCTENLNTDVVMVKPAEDRV